MPRRLFAFIVIPSQSADWRGNPFPAPAGAHLSPVGVSKEGGPQPSLFGRFKERGFLRGEGNRNPSPLKWRFWLLLSLLTKVTRRRQKRKDVRGGQSRPPLHTPTESPYAPFTEHPTTRRRQKRGPPPGGPPFSLSINLSCHSEEHPKGTCFAARSDVGIRNLLTTDLHENA